MTRESAAYPIRRENSPLSGGILLCHVINAPESAYILQTIEIEVFSMPYDDKYAEKHAALPQHNLIIEGRSRAAVSGVTDVESFDENEIIMATTMGVLFLRGTGLRIDKLSLDTGDVTIDGSIDKFEYEDDARAPQGGFFSRLFR
jgi:sporulation protein YabP